MRRPRQEQPGSVWYCSAMHRGQNQRGASVWLSHRGGRSLGRGRYVVIRSFLFNASGDKGPARRPDSLAGREKIEKKIDKGQSLCYNIPCCWAERANYG